jgi:Flp pilus assembly protein TadG
LHARRDERGSVELVVATPLLLVMILMVIQFAMYEHASQVAQATAAQALAATRTVDGTTATGQTEGQAVMASIGHGVLDNPQIEVSRTQTTAAVTVHGTTEGIVPLWHLSVSASSSGPVERFASGR